ncbi:MAG: hypothetical protein AAB358_04015 [Patescibacteria group bacterium]
MKKSLTIYLIFIFFLCFSFVFVPIVQADPPAGGQTPTGGQTPVGQTNSLNNPLGNDATFEAVVNRAINYILGIVGVLGLIAFIYGGVEWMIASGDTAKITKGKTTMVWAVWGMAVIFASYAVIKFVLGALLTR